MFAVVILLIILIILYYFLLKPQLYWKSKHVNQGIPIPLLGDSLKTTFKTESMADMVRRLYERDPDSRYTGVYQTTTPILMIRDPKLIKDITVKDFDHFTDHFNFVTNDAEPIWSKTLFSLTGEKWRAMRSTLTPTFTASKMRLMFELMEKSAHQYVEYYLENTKDSMELELKESFRRFANDVIANCAFGVTVNSLKNPKNEFFLKGEEITNFRGFWKNFKMLMIIIVPKIAAFFGWRFFSAQTTQFFKELVKDTLKYRENNNILRPDMINLLMEASKGKLKNEVSRMKDDTSFATVQETYFKQTEHVAMTEDDMTAQVIIFFFAGFETISVISSLMCYELAVNPEEQEKLRQEIDAIFNANKGKLSYDILNKMKYMDMVISESLRKHPPVSALDRVCTKAYTIQPESSDEEPIHLAPGQILWLPANGLHYDEKYYPNPTKFIPERFSDENKDEIKPYTYIPFGSGPRSCIASRFALMEVKMLVFHILRNFEITVIERTCVPLKYDTYQFNPTVEGGCWVGFKRRPNSTSG